MTGLAVLGGLVLTLVLYLTRRRTSKTGKTLTVKRAIRVWGMGIKE